MTKPTAAVGGKYQRNLHATDFHQAPITMSMPAKKREKEVDAPLKRLAGGRLVIRELTRCPVTVG